LRLAGAICGPDAAPPAPGWLRSPSYRADPLWPDSTCWSARWLVR